MPAHVEEHVCLRIRPPLIQVNSHCGMFVYPGCELYPTGQEMLATSETYLRVSLTGWFRRLAILASFLALAGLVFAQNAPLLAATAHAPAPVIAVHGGHQSPAARPGVQLSGCPQHSQCPMHHAIAPVLAAFSSSHAAVILRVDNPLPAGWRVLPLRRPPRA